MTEAAVVDGGALAPAEVPINPHVHTPEPVSGVPPTQQAQGQEQADANAGAKPEKGERKPVSIDDALKNAVEKAKAKAEAKLAAKEPAEKGEKAPQPKDVPAAEAKPQPDRGPDGKFQPKQAAETGQQPAVQPPQGPAPQKLTHYPEAPARFHDGAKAEWAHAPESVRAEIHRTVSELEKGIQKYRADAEAYQRIREFDEIARRNGGDLRESLQKVVEIEQALAKNPIAGLDRILREIGPRKPDGTPLTLLDVAAHVMGQKPEERALQQNSTIAALQAEIEGLKRQLGGVSQTIQQQAQQSVMQTVEAFAKDHPRFEELSDDIEFFLKTKRATTLQEAYELAERLNPAAQPPAQAAHTGAPPETLAHTQQPEPRPLNPAGKKSVAGAPSAAADAVFSTAKKGPAPSIDEALERALRRAS